MAPPTPQERFDEAKKHAAFLRALYSQPGLNLTPEGLPDRARTAPTLYNVTDFELNTYKNYILPLLPPDASKNCRDLAIPGQEGAKDNMALLADDLYPRMQVGGFQEKWQDSVGRTVMISSIVQDQNRQMIFGGSFPFSEDVRRAAAALSG